MRRLDDILEAVKSYHPEPHIALVQKAYIYSAKVHAGQLRKSGEPYLVHPLEVSYLLTQLRLDEASVVTGLLHDTLEDTLASFAELEELFGLEVATLVDGVTKLSRIHFDTDEHKQAENFRKMLLAMAKDIRVILIKLCDRLHNMRTLEFLASHKQRRIAQETMEIYAPLANRLGLGWIKSELEDLAFSYLHPLEFKDLQKRTHRLTFERKAYVDEVIALLQQELAQCQIPCLVEGRPKHLYSIYCKLLRRQIEFEQLYDVIAFRVIVETASLCYEVLGHIHSMWRPIPGRFKDYIAMPKANQYQSLHTSVIGPRGERIEIQIRTYEMHRIAEEGIAAHWEYKEHKQDHKKSKQQFAWLRQLLEWQQDLKDPNEFLDTVKYDLFVDEVFVFTPRGEVISLKRGATPVDFAFAIHSAIGTHCAGAKINGRIVPLRYELKNGDMVEILTNQHQKPSKDWLNFVRTGKARSKIRTLVRAEERERSKEVGQHLLDRELKRFNVTLTKFIRDGSLQKVAENSRFKSLDSLFVALGYGRATVNTITTQLVHEAKAAETQAHKSAQSISSASSSPTTSTSTPDSDSGRSANGVLVEGMDNVLVRFGRCCNPLPGNMIVGFITRGRGVTVHVANCSRALDIDPERRIEVGWDTQNSLSRSVTLRVSTSDRPGMLATISQVFTDHHVNIMQANCKVIVPSHAINTFEVMIKDAGQLHRVIGQIKAISGVLNVERL